ncbi:metallophosphoesterase [Naumannella sp. ID2617S]|nr:metallophosphoesterase [Naumannella sp. ID2617S]
MVNAFFLIPLLLIGGSCWFLYVRLAGATALPRGWRIAVLAGLLALFGLVFTQFAAPARLPPAVMRPFVWLGGVWLAVWGYLTLALLVVALGSLIVRIVNRGGDSRPARLGWNRRAVPVAVLAVLLLVGVGVTRSADPRITELRYASPAVTPGLDGLRIALVTDLHVGPLRGAEFTRLVVERVNAARPDLVILGGDLVDGDRERFEGVLEPLRELRAPLGAYAVTGNHEFYNSSTESWLQRWQQLGVTVLRNEHRILTNNGAHLVVAGVNDWSGQGTFAPDPEAALAGVPQDAFLLLAAHQPRQALRTQGKGVDLQLSGHTHGGQLWPGRQLVPLQQPMVEGLARVGDVPVFTSRGAGGWGTPVRIGADPQLPVITLTRG